MRVIYDIVKIQKLKEVKLLFGLIGLLLHYIRLQVMEGNRNAVLIMTNYYFRVKGTRNDTPLTTWNLSMTFEH